MPALLLQVTSMVVLVGVTALFAHQVEPFNAIPEKVHMGAPENSPELILIV